MIECTDPQLRELIHGYELDQLSADERQRFETHLFMCPFCLKEAQAMTRVSSFAVQHREELLETLRADGLSFDQISRRLRARRESVWERLAGVFQGWQRQAALAGALAVIILLAIVLKPRPAASPYEGYLSYELPAYRNDVRLRGEAEDEATRLFESAMDSYAAGNYAAASKGIKRSLKLDSQQPDRWLYLGAAQFAQKKPKAAIESLRNADRDGKGVTKIRARWYLAQSYLLNGEVRPAEDLLEWLVARDGEHAEDARSLLAKLREHEQ